MFDKWVGLLNFYIIMASVGELTIDFFDEERLAKLYAEFPGMDMDSMDAAAQKLVLEFQAQKANTEIKIDSSLPSNSPAGENQEIPDGVIPIPMF